MPGPHDSRWLALAPLLEWSREEEYRLRKRRRLVADARAEGCSWSMIGRALGVSRQAAIKRYADDPTMVSRKAAAEIQAARRDQVS